MEFRASELANITRLDDVVATTLEGIEHLTNLRTLSLRFSPTDGVELARLVPQGGLGLSFLESLDLTETGLEFQLSSVQQTLASFPRLRDLQVSFGAALGGVCLPTCCCYAGRL